MSQECCTENKEIMILACSGSSNLGQLANQAAVELTREGFGKMSCLAAVGAHLDNFVQSARNASTLVAIDGCPLCSAKHPLEHAGDSLQSMCFSTISGSKRPGTRFSDPAEVEKVKAAFEDACNGHVRTVAVNAGPSPSCCG